MILYAKSKTGNLKNLVVQNYVLIQFVESRLKSVILFKDESFKQVKEIVYRTTSGVKKETNNQKLIEFYRKLGFNSLPEFCEFCGSKTFYGKILKEKTLISKLQIKSKEFKGDAQRKAFFDGVNAEKGDHNPYKKTNWGFALAFEKGRTFTRLNGRVEVNQLNLF